VATLGDYKEGCIEEGSAQEEKDRCLTIDRVELVVIDGFFLKSFSRK
jgi:hypothetical protein